MAIVGVSEQSGSGAPGYTGSKIFRILREAGFEGRLYPVNPKLSQIDGVKVYPSVTEVPEPLDLVTITVQAARVPQVLEECVAVRAANVHICSSGFAETGQDEGRRLEDRIREIAQRGGLRVIGPNCMGLHVPSVRMKMFEDISVVEGPVAFVSQSGGHALVFLKHGPDFGLGFSKVISYGNALTLDAPDYLEYLGADPETQIVCMYLEGTRDGAKLLELARRTNQVKPVVIWKAGLTGSGARAAASHTGSMAGDRQIWDAFFKQTGAIKVGSIQEMAEVAMTLLLLQPSPRRRVVVLSIGGGANVATGDLCAEEGLEVPPLSSETKTALLEFITPVNQGVTNPMDLSGVLTHAPLLRRTLDVLKQDPCIDVSILHIPPDLFTFVSVADFEKVILDQRHPGSGGKAIVVAFDEAHPSENAQKYAQELRQAGITTYGSLRRACRALRRFAGYHEFLSETGARAESD
jgi:acyl-CoA synthetase (NDP forming)